MLVQLFFSNRIIDILVLNTFRSILKWFVFIWPSHCNRLYLHCNRLYLVFPLQAMEMFAIFAYPTVTIVHFTDQRWVSKTVYCIRCAMVYKTNFTNWRAKIALLRAFMVVTDFIKLFQTGVDRHNGILIPLLLLVPGKMTLR